MSRPYRHRKLLDQAANARQAGLSFHAPKLRQIFAEIVFLRLYSLLEESSPHVLAAIRKRCLELQNHSSRHLFRMRGCECDNRLAAG
jgi:hypothetical protein